MTAEELIRQFNDDYGKTYDAKWPITYEVDAITYANCCQAIFNLLLVTSEGYSFGNNHLISLGHNRGLMFKGVELILKSDA